jgi:hypothetical protein
MPLPRVFVTRNVAVVVNRCSPTADVGSGDADRAIGTVAVGAATGGVGLAAAISATGDALGIACWVAATLAASRSDEPELTI